ITHRILSEGCALIRWVNRVSEGFKVPKEMLIEGILPVISSQMQKCDFVFAYKSSTCVFDL
ncbi:MAG: hypothetical protein Q9M12_07655, partial [Mariprofundus sp.]|nr:hypothetical protein [Mariprofundus sp.]